MNFRCEALLASVFWRSCLIRAILALACADGGSVMPDLAHFRGAVDAPRVFRTPHLLMLVLTKRLNLLPDFAFLLLPRRLNLLPDLHLSSQNILPKNLWQSNTQVQSHAGIGVFHKVAAAMRLHGMDVCKLEVWHGFAGCCYQVRVNIFFEPRF